MIVTPADQISDNKCVATAVIGASSLRVDQGNLHPFVNAEIDDLRADQLLSFIPSCGRKPLIVEFAQPRPD